MPTVRLFGNRITPACKYCEECFQKTDEAYVLCSKNGIVGADYACRKYRYDPIKRVPAKPVLNMDYNEDDFKL